MLKSGLRGIETLISKNKMKVFRVWVVACLLAIAV
jgi:hypothetical protein